MRLTQTEASRDCPPFSDHSLDLIFHQFHPLKPSLEKGGITELDLVMRNLDIGGVYRHRIMEFAL